MAADRREPPASFMYEPSSPPSIPPHLTIAEWRRQVRRRWRRGVLARWRRATRAEGRRLAA
jgi:hypothetical protein